MMLMDRQLRPLRFNLREILHFHRTLKLDILPHVIESTRKNIKHTIVNIYVVSPNSVEIKTFCAEKNCIFADENIISANYKKGY